MKSNKWRKVIIKDQKLRQLRKNMRTILTLALRAEVRRVLDLKRSEKYNEGISSTALMNARHYSILLCSSGTPCYSAYAADKSFYTTSLDVDMVWNPIDKEWICINCYNELFGTDELKKGYQDYIDEERRIDDEIDEAMGISRG